jgi:hypothetical protein
LNEPAGWLDDIWLACRDDYYPNGYGIVREAFPGKVATEKYPRIYLINKKLGKKFREKVNLNCICKCKGQFNKISYCENCRG